MNIAGKIALITGGTSGIGKEMAKAFAESGAHVIAWGTNSEKAAKALEEIRSAAKEPSQKVKTEVVDVADTEKVQSAIDALLKEFGQIDILINNAGITQDTLLMKMTEEQWDRVLDVNLKSVYNTCKALIRPMMKAKGGKIINVTSVVGLTGNPGQVNYAASKAGMIGLTKSLAKEVGTRGINVNCIAPGFITTPMTDRLTDAQKEGLMDTIPMKRLGVPRDIAMAALFLASSHSDYITGQVLVVDGGMVM